MGSSHIPFTCYQPALSFILVMRPVWNETFGECTFLNVFFLFDPSVGDDDDAPELS